MWVLEAKQTITLLIYHEILKPKNFTQKVKLHFKNKLWVRKQIIANYQDSEVLLQFNANQNSIYIYKNNKTLLCPSPRGILTSEI